MVISRIGVYASLPMILALGECAIYVTALNERFGLHGVVRHHRLQRVSRDYPYLWFPAQDCGPLQRLMQGHLLPSFYYKLDMDSGRGRDVVGR